MASKGIVGREYCILELRPPSQWVREERLDQLHRLVGHRLWVSDKLPLLLRVAIVVRRLDLLPECIVYRATARFWKDEPQGSCCPTRSRLLRGPGHLEVTATVRPLSSLVPRYPLELTLSVGQRNKPHPPV